MTKTIKGIICGAGWYMLAKGKGILKVGDEMKVLKTREGPPTKLAAGAA